MSNKTTLQSYNSKIRTNNNDLNSILETINNLPDAGSGEIALQEKTITPTTSNQNIVADSGYNGLSKVVVNAVTSSIDSDIKASNIRKNINILGITGTLEEGITPTGTLNISANGTYDVTNYASAKVNVASTSKKSATGTFNLSSGVADYTLNLGFKPKVVVVNMLSTSATSGLGTISWVKTTSTMNCVILQNLSTKVYTFKMEDYAEVTDTGIKIKRYGSYNIPAGTYSYEAYE